MKIWHLDFELDEFDNLVPVEEISLDEIQSFNGSSKIELWKPIIVKKMEEKELSNAPGFYSHIPVFDKVTLDVVKDLIKDSAEALPLLCDEGEFYAINVIEVLDCINYDKAQFKTFRDGKRIMRFIKYEFTKNVVNGKHIFKIVDEPLRRPFVSNEFRQRVIDCNLKGFKFELVWDSEE
jgi:Immunity protein family (Imm11)